MNSNRGRASSAARETEKTFWQHFEELRLRLLISLVVLVVASGLCYFVRNQLFVFLVSPMTRLQKELVALAPTEKFTSLIKICLLGGFILSFPFILNQFWRFLAPGLTARERNHVFPLLLLAPLFFLTGCAFAFFLIIPLGLQFLFRVIPQIRETISLRYYISFLLKLLLAFGLVFNLPLLLAGLVKLNLTSRQKLRENRKYFIPLVFLAAAVLTPPDVFTQILLAVPILILYELSILFAGMTAGKNAL